MAADDLFGPDGAGETSSTPSIAAATQPNTDRVAAMLRLLPAGPVLPSPAVKDRGCGGRKATGRCRALNSA
ncbi:MAG: hypothetical protein JKP98_24570 [Rhodobacteraceae bacterium]|nr:hypothetical protein [Paracoccaceae bacterium]